MKYNRKNQRRSRPADPAQWFSGACFTIAGLLIFTTVLQRCSSTGPPSVTPESPPVSHSVTPSPTIQPQAVRRVIVDLSDFTVTVLDDNRVLASFPMTHGRPSRETRPGDYRITEIVQNPLWDDPETPEREALAGELGTWWMALYDIPNGTVGFHGLPARREHLVTEKKVGTSGCLGMRDADIIAFRRYVAVGTPVHIQQ